jgi:hypothetical protein
VTCHGVELSLSVNDMGVGLVCLLDSSIMSSRNLIDEFEHALPESLCPVMSVDKSL